jgi:hypothetical protein
MDALQMMRKLIVNLIFCMQVMLCSLVLVNQANAEEDVDAALRDGNRYEENIGGLVINQTITPQGRDFYRAFVIAWRNQSESTRDNIVIYERPAGRGTNLLWVEYRYRKLYSAFVRMSKQSVLEGMAANAVLIVQQGIAAIQVEEIMNSTDMASDEF